MKLRELFKNRDTNDRGFNMLELIMVVVVIGILGGIGFAIYRGVSDQARGTVLDSNIQTAAEELTGLLEVNPLAADTPDALAAAMTDRTNFVWESSWDFDGTEGPDVIRFEMLTKGAPPTAGLVSGTPPAVNWITSTDGAAIRIHARNSEEQWRCALVIRHVSRDELTGTAPALDSSKYGIVGATGTAVVVASLPAAALAAAEIGGLWFDGGNTIVDNGLHDCSPFGSVTSATCLDTTGTAQVSDGCLPDTANSWNIPDEDGHVDATSTNGTSQRSSTHAMRTLHGSIGQLDSPS